MMSELDHGNIVSVIGYALHPFLLIVMEYVGGGNVKDHVGINGAGVLMQPVPASVIMKILVGTAHACQYLHGRPVPILHRDIKSENILLTEEFHPILADFGEARAVAKEGMTRVGTNGYTAPEVLRGEHYGTAADVFSFAIVMAEVTTHRAPYADLREEQNLSLEEIAAMTHTRNLRPTLPIDMDKQTVDLITECWADDAKRRPSFPVIIFRLQVVAHMARMGGSGNFNTEDEKTMRALCRRIHDLFWLVKANEWDEGMAALILDPSITLDADNVTLGKILRSAGKGPEAVKSLARMMFGGLKDGAEIVAEPLLEEHIVVNVDECWALVAFHFSIKPPARQHQWTGKDKREFDGLRRALAKLERGALDLDGDDSGLEKAIARGDGSGQKTSNIKAAPEFPVGVEEGSVVAENGTKAPLEFTSSSQSTKVLPRYTKQKPARTNSNNRNVRSQNLDDRASLKRRWKKKKDKENRTKSAKRNQKLLDFMKACRYVRGVGASSVHP